MFSRSILRSIPQTRRPALFLQPHAQLRFLSTQYREAIQQAVSSYPLVVFMKGTPQAPQCGFSRAVAQIIEVQGVIPSKLKTYNVLADAELRDGIKEFSDWPTIPQVYVNGEFIGGCDIVLGMHQNGELEELFAKEGIIDLTDDGSGSGSEDKK